MTLVRANVRNVAGIIPRLTSTPPNSYRNLSALPKLPVPQLAKTLDRFLRVSKPILSANDYNKTKKIVFDFGKAGGEGETLQKVLEDRHKSMDNWLSDWWMDVAYLSQRRPLPVVFSPGVIFPKLDYSGQKGQLDTAGELCAVMLQFKDLIDSGKLKPDLQGGKPLEMIQYHHLLGTNRIPGIDKDKMRYGNEEKSKIRHIAVARNGHFFHVDVYDQSFTPLNSAQISAQLSKVVENSQSPNPHPITVCSSQERNAWATTYNRIRGSSRNAANLESLESSLFILGLDGDVTPKAGRTDKDQHGRLSLYGAGGNEGNRWFDKTLQLALDQSGHVAFNYEHSPAEAGPVAALVDFYMQHRTSKTAASQAPCSGSYSEPNRLDFDLTDSDKADIEAALHRLDEVDQDLELRMVSFDGFGKSLPKAQKLSPDSFCQLGFQLAFYSLHKAQPPTYESGSLRAFHLGRTDQIRLPTEQSAAFTEAMMSDKKSDVDKAQLLRNAIESHKEYTMAVMSAEGIDRHLLGLRLAAQQKGVPTPSIFASPGFARMSRFKLGTSQVPAKNDAQCCYGPSFDDDCAICYNPMENKINLSIAAWNSCPDTDGKKLEQALAESFYEMRKVLEA